MGRRRRGNPVNGWLAIDKAEDMTSTEVVNRARRALNAQKAGHAGTLDPLATGVLPIALGEATKTVPHLVDARKIYEFTIQWGEKRTTDDLEGEVEATSAHRPGAEAIAAALPAFIGAIEQTPPQFSAIKINGERAYDIARRGEEATIAPRTVVVHAFEILDHPDQDHTRARVVCGKGTYIRALARDLGARLGTYGAIAQLRRTAVGPFDETRTISLEKLEEFGDSPPTFEALLPVSTALDDIPALAVTEIEAARLRSGQPIRVLGKVGVTRHPPQSLAAREVKGPAYAELVAGTHRLPVAVGSVKAGEFKPSRVFNL